LQQKGSLPGFYTARLVSVLAGAGSSIAGDFQNIIKKTYRKGEKPE
jgi:hypothetical protein